MKTIVNTIIFAVLFASGMIAGAQDRSDDYLGLPGDNLNLYAVMKLFQESETLEGFERNLNDEKSRINNLDLNGDNQVDYIMVHDYVDGNVHNIVLRVALGRDEFQDVAVFTVERFSDGSARIQLVGDEELYGKNYIIEPYYAGQEGETPNPGYTGTYRRGTSVTVITTTPYEIAAWPLVRFIFLPGYISWHSSWYWGYYPVYWRPWRPWYWHFYCGYHSHWHHHYYAHYRVWHHYRYHRYHDYYYRTVRYHSPRLHAGVREGRYRSTYSRPDLRREGSAYFARTNPGRTDRMVNQQSNPDRSARSLSGSGRNPSSRSSFSGAERGSASRISERSAVRSSTGTGTTLSRRSGSGSGQADRSSTTVRSRNSSVPSGISSRSTARPSVNQGTVSRRSAPAVTQKSASKPPSYGNRSTSRSASPAVSSRSASRSHSPQVSASARGQSRSSSPAMRSGGGSHSGNRAAAAGSGRSSSGSHSGSRSGRR